MTHTLIVTIDQNDELGYDNPTLSLECSWPADDPGRPCRAWVECATCGTSGWDDVRDDSCETCNGDGKHPDDSYRGCGFAPYMGDTPEVFVPTATIKARAEVDVSLWGMEDVEGAIAPAKEDSP